jgi:hypothetical protein
VRDAECQGSDAARELKQDRAAFTERVLPAPDWPDFADMRQFSNVLSSLMHRFENEQRNLEDSRWMFDLQFDPSG